MPFLAILSLSFIALVEPCTCMWSHVLNTLTAHSVVLHTIVWWLYFDFSCVHVATLLQHIHQLTATLSQVCGVFPICSVCRALGSLWLGLHGTSTIASWVTTSHQSLFIQTHSDQSGHLLGWRPLESYWVPCCLLRRMCRCVCVCLCAFVHACVHVYALVDTCICTHVHVCIILASNKQKLKQSPALCANWTINQSEAHKFQSRHVYHYTLLFQPLRYCPWMLELCVHAHYKDCYVRVRDQLTGIYGRKFPSPRATA